jgi:3',5'-cyclic-AMP phosphodiesterase
MSAVRRAVLTLGRALPLLLLTCVDTTNERSQVEDTIGSARASGTSVVVEDGLAAIRRLDASELSLWAGAPSLVMRVERAADAPPAFTLTVDNAMPDAVLEAVTATGDVVTVESVPRDRPTQKQWSVTLLPGSDATLWVHPARDEPTTTWRFALLSDIQEAIDRVQDIYSRMNADPSIAFVVSAGDLTTQGKAEQLDRFQHELERLSVPFFTTLGNHELGTGSVPFHDYFGRADFRFVYGSMQFTFLDSGSATLDPLVYDWLDGWLAEGQSRLHTVIMHIPPIDPIGVRNGSFANRNEAAKLLAKLASGHVDLTLYGHIHSYYPFSNAGIPAYISGGGGAIPERFDGIGRHYLTIDVDPAHGVLQTAIVRINSD